MLLLKPSLRRSGLLRHCSYFGIICFLKRWLSEREIMNDFCSYKEDPSLMMHGEPPTFPEDSKDRYRKHQSRDFLSKRMPIVTIAVAIVFENFRWAKRFQERAEVACGGEGLLNDDLSLEGLKPL